MEIILNNPYRITGLLVGTTLKDQTKQINRLKKFIEAEQEVTDDFSFPILGRLTRDENSVTDASSRLNLDSDRMHAALFWFYNGNVITDEPAFDSLKEGDLLTVNEIWSKLIRTDEITQRNCSAHHNLSNLLLCNAFEGHNINLALLEEGVRLKLKFLESDFVKDFKSLTTDATYKTSKKELQSAFLKQLNFEISKFKGHSSYELIEILNKVEFSAKEDYLKELSQRLIGQIEKEIETVRKKANQNKGEAADFGNELYNVTINDLHRLKSILGANDLRLIAIADNIANEMLQCGIDLFNYFHETETEISDVVLELIKKASQIALGNIVKERIKENSVVIEAYQKDRPIREKEKRINTELKFINNKLIDFQILEDSINNASDLINTCKPHLDSIRSKFGVNDDLYLGISSQVVGNAQGMLISLINDAIDKGHTEKLKSLMKPAWKFTATVGVFDMSSKQRDSYERNRKSLKDLYEKIDGGIIFLNDTPVDKWILWIGGILLFLLIVYVGWGEEGLGNVFGFVVLIGLLWLIGLARSSSRRRR